MTFKKLPLTDCCRMVVNMEESLFVAGFVLTREDWDALGDEGRKQILATLKLRSELPRGPVLEKKGLASKVSPLPLPPPR